MKNIFTEHPHSLGETYLQHMKYALMTGSLMILGGLACTIHAFFPFLFQQTASNILLKLTHVFVERMPRDEYRIKNLHQFINNKFGDENDQSSV